MPQDLINRSIPSFTKQLRAYIKVNGEHFEYVWWCGMIIQGRSRSSSIKSPYAKVCHCNCSLYAYLRLFPTTLCCKLTWYYFFLYYFYSFLISFTLCMLPLLVANKGCHMCQILQKFVNVCSNHSEVKRVTFFGTQCRNVCP